MTLLAHRGEGPAFSYAGQPMHILAGQSGQPRGFAAMELAVPPHFAGPIPHAHDGFDEAIYVLSGRLLVVGEDEPQEAVPGSMFVALRGNRHGFSNPFREEAQVLGLWAPPKPALAFMREIGAALTPDTPPDPDHMREIFTPGTPAASCPDITAASLPSISEHEATPHMRHVRTSARSLPGADST
jgi:mannose-6-phosphate isomerase-like protein (cupin superfamily)